MPNDMTEPMSEPVAVEQVDRDAAADCRVAYSGYDSGSAQTYRNGQRDNSTLVQAFARHRADAVKKATEARDGL